MTLHVGFTGSRLPISSQQRFWLRDALCRVPSDTVVHHGDCVGADADVHVEALWHDLPVVLHPGHDGSGQSPSRAWCRGEVFAWAPAPYLDRNREIVRSSHVLVALPSGPETIRSGTWSTVRFARRTGVPVIVVIPDGSIRG